MTSELLLFPHLFKGCGQCDGVVAEGRSYFTTDGRSVCLGIEHPCGTCDQIFLPVGMFTSWKIAGWRPSEANGYFQFT
jgi:hypothetical protein